MALSDNGNGKHVAVFPFPAGGHLAILLNLALKLAQDAPNVRFSFFATAKFNQTLSSKSHIPENINAYIVADGVPEGHALGVNPEEPINYFLQAGPRNLQKAIDLAVEETKERVTCIIADALVTPSFIVSQHLQVPWIALWVAHPCALSAHVYTDSIRQRHANGKIETLDFIPGLSMIFFEDLPDHVRNGDKNSIFSRTVDSMGKVLPQAKSVLMNFNEEFVPSSCVEDLKSKFQSLLHIGFLSVSLPLPPLPPSDTDATGCLSWLDRQRTKSVAFVCFGTVMIPPPHELVAIAEALEESKIPFLWSLKDNFWGLLPNGFLERTSMRGKIVPWAPQAHVLGHDAVGVHVTHCGLNSMFESILYEVPIICRPLIADNWINARIVEDEWGIGVRVEGGVFSKKGFIKSLKLVLLEEEGIKMRKKIHAVKQNVVDAAGPNGRAAHDFKALVDLISSSN